MPLRTRAHDRQSAGREAELARCVDEHGGRLYQLGLRLCGDRGKAEDLVQETFLRAWRKWDQFEARSTRGTWLFSIAARVCTRMQRRRAGEPRRLQSLESLLPFESERLAVVPDGPDGPFGQSLLEDARVEIERALAQIPTAFRLPFVLKEVAGMSLVEIGAVLGIKEQTVKTRVHRARLLARRAIEGVLPQRKVAPTALSRRLCMDLLRAKQESLDRKVRFRFPDRIVCERCAELFATLNLTQQACAQIGRGQLPAAVRARVLREISRDAGTSGLAVAPSSQRGGVRRPARRSHP